MNDNTEREFIITRLMKALEVEDKALVEIRRNLDDARAQYEVASHKFAAVRDLAAGRLQRNPYMVDQSEYGVTFQSNGRFAFLLMNPGDAAAEVLKESEKPLSLEEIYEAVRAGGLRAMTARMLNASLMKRGGVVKQKDGTYRYEEEKVPFE